VRGSLRLLRAFGIDISVHWTFLLLIAWVVFDATRRGANAAGAAAAVVFVVAIFVCVVLHELGHALTARRFGIQTRGITLLPIGGVAALERMPTEPVQELLIAVAGPAVNVAIAGVLFPVAYFVGDIEMAEAPLAATGVGFLGQLALVNLALVVFNMLPAFPMDGGRVLRALLAIWMDYGRATAIAAGAGQVMAMLFVMWGLFGGNPMLVLIAVFVFLGGQAEAHAAQTRSAMVGARVADAMLTEFRVLSPDATLREAADALIAGSQQDFPVVDAELGLVGMLSRRQLIEGASRAGFGGLVAEAMGRDGRPLRETDDLASAIESLGSREPAAAVVRNGRVVGLLTQENVGEYLMLREAARRR